MITKIDIAEPYVDMENDDCGSIAFATDYDCSEEYDEFGLSEDEIKQAIALREGFVDIVIEEYLAEANSLLARHLKSDCTYHFKTKDGWKIVGRFMDNVIVNRGNGDYAVGHHYDERTGQWSHGHYPGTYEGAQRELIRCCMMDLGIREEKCE